MTICEKPPEGWICSRPLEYAETIYHKIKKKRNKWKWGAPKMSKRQFCDLLGDAWRDGARYAAKLLEGK